VLLLLLLLLLRAARMREQAIVDLLRCLRRVTSRSAYCSFSHRTRNSFCGPLTSATNEI
jgi:hypothetical protein